MNRKEPQPLNNIGNHSVTRQDGRNSNVSQTQTTLKITRPSPPPAPPAPPAVKKQ